MAYEKKSGDISIFRNDRKEKDTHPDYRGVGLGLNGEKIKVALWLKKDRNGNTFMAGKIEPDAYERSGDSDRPRQMSGPKGVDDSRYDLNDDIPF